METAIAHANANDSGHSLNKWLWELVCVPNKQRTGVNSVPRRGGHYRLARTDDRGKCVTQ